MAAVCMLCASLRPPPTRSQPGADDGRIWASWRARFRRSSPHADQEAAWRGTHTSAVQSESSAASASVAYRACPQQCQALSHRQRPPPPVARRRPRSGDGTLLCAAQRLGAPHTLATNNVSGRNANGIEAMNGKSRIFRMLLCCVRNLEERFRKHSLNKHGYAPIVTGISDACNLLFFRG
jgi:hypothetical protein